MIKVMIIEDSIFERKAISRYLKEAGYNDIIEAANGEEGLKLANTEKPDIVLLDLRMPGMDGMDVIKELKKNHENVKILVVSIIRNKKIVDKCLELGADGYLSKPVTQENLVEKIKEILASSS